jgi:hypothetical protein
MYDDDGEALNEALTKIVLVTPEELLTQLDGMDGRGNLPENYSHEQLLNEAKRQLIKAHTKPDNDWLGGIRSFFKKFL